MARKYEEMMKTKFLPFRIGQMTERFAEQAKKELNETEEVKEKALKELRKRLQAEDIVQPDDAFLVEFLRPRKFEVERAHQLLHSFFEVKKEYKECFGNVDYDELLNGIGKSGLVSYLPFRTPDGCVIFLIDLSKWDTSKYDMVEATRLVALIALSCLEDPTVQVSGVKILLNAKGASYRIIKFLTPRYVTLLSKTLRNCLPTRFKGIHFFNETVVLQYIWSLIKLFLSEKIKNRVHFHSDNLKSLHSHLPKELLTEEYGGLNKYFDQGDMCTKLLTEGRERVLKILSYGYKN